MPPKKKVAAKSDGNAEQSSKAVEQPVAVQPAEQKKEQTKPQSKAQQVSQPAPVSNSNQELKNEDPASETKVVKKISINESLPISEEEKLRLRKLRFSGTIGTDVTPQEAQRVTNELQQIKKQRIQKFGGSLNEPLSKEEIEKRKAKFGSQNTGQDEETLRKRRQKFNTTSSLLPNEDMKTLEERRKKFGGGETIIDLDEQIRKTKPIHKDDKNRNHHKGRNNFKNRGAKH